VFCVYKASVATHSVVKVNKMLSAGRCQLDVFIVKTLQFYCLLNVTVICVGLIEFY